MWFIKLTLIYSTVCFKLFCVFVWCVPEHLYYSIILYMFHVLYFPYISTFLPISINLDTIMYTSEYMHVARDFCFYRLVFIIMDCVYGAFTHVYRIRAYRMWSNIILCFGCWYWYILVRMFLYIELFLYIFRVVSTHEIVSFFVDFYFICITHAFHFISLDFILVKPHLYKSNKNRTEFYFLFLHIIRRFRHRIYGFWFVFVCGVPLPLTYNKRYDSLCICPMIH